jgi:hypothetical protein
MTSPMPPQLTDAAIERMLARRAGPGAPLDLVRVVSQRVDVTPQRRLGLWAPNRNAATARARVLVIAAAIALVSLVLGLALVGSWLLRSGPIDLPLPAELQDRWLGDPTDLADGGASSQPILDMSNGDLVLRGSGLTGELLASSAATSPDGTLRFTAARGGCPTDSPGSYRYTVSPGGKILTLAAVEDACQDRSDALVGTWYRAAQRCKSGGLCLGELEAGTFKSVNLDVRLSHAEIAGYVPTFGVLTYTVPDGWAAGRDSRTQLALEPTTDEWRTNPDDQKPFIFVFARPTAFSQDDGCPYAALDPPIEPSADAFARWMAERPGVDAGPIHEITIGGHPGRWLDMTQAATWTSACPWSAGEPYAPLLFFDQGDDGVMGIGSTTHDRYLIVDLGNGALVAIILHTVVPVSLEAFAAEAMPIVGSFEFR